MGSIKRIGVLTSGGDAPGMNAAVRAVVRAGIYSGLSVCGVRRGYEGLLRGETQEMSMRSVSDILGRGGTVLQTSRSKEFMTPEGIQRAARMTEVFKLDALVIIGGDGSFCGAQKLMRMGVPVIGIPATIDNDIGCTSYTIGFDTALNTVKDAIDKIKDTAYSHERCSIVEVMGREAGYIALHCAIANGAEACVFPEKVFDINEDLIKPLIECRNRGKSHYIVIMAEGVDVIADVARHVKELTGISTTVSILGYLQRGGSPTVRDRITASLMGLQAAELLAAGTADRILGVQQDRIVDIPVEEALSMKKTLDESMIRASRILSL